MSVAACAANPMRTTATGLGLRVPHLNAVLAAAEPPAWMEVHPENFLANPHAGELLIEIARRSPISMHTVGLSVGSADGVDRDHLLAVRRLVDATKPVFVSGHLAWSTHHGRYLNDLLPLPYNAETLRLVADNVRRVQDALRQPYLLENPASYVGFRDSTLSEPEFLAELVYRTDCRLLCDVSNIIVSASNLGFDPYAYLESFPGSAIGEIHLGGYTVEAESGDDKRLVLIDSHDGAIQDPAWRLYAYALQRFGPRPTLIEWDAQLPELSRLSDEAFRASKYLEQASGNVHAIAC